MTDGPIHSDAAPPAPEAELHTRSQWSLRVELLVAALAVVEQGRTVTYEALSTLTGVQDREELHSLANAARKQVLEEPGFVFRAIDNVGYARLTDAEIAARVPVESRARMRRRASRTRKELECVTDFSALTPADRAKWNAGYAINSVVEHALHATRVQTVLTGVSSSEQQRIAAANLIEMLTGKKDKPNSGQ